jgi:hypothetical protein
MNREEVIKKAAEHYAELVDKEYNIYSSTKRIVKSAYQVGAEYADTHPIDVWHDASEKPHTKEWILVQFGEDDYEALALNDLGVDTWLDGWCNNYKVRRWAYIRDLMPKGGEK